jgi:hypothetical protein
MSGYVVVMRDRFMSNWGRAEGRSSIFAVHCNTEAEAEQIAEAAGHKAEMEKIKICHELPQYSEKTHHISERNFSDLSPDWRGDS